MGVADGAAPSLSSIARSLRRMSVLFALADALFLMVVELASNSAMHLIRALEWNLVLTLVLGMAAAMAVQMALAIIAAPVLGSTETMVPSMIVGMLSPMQLCAVELIGYPPHRRRESPRAPRLGWLRLSPFDPGDDPTADSSAEPSRKCENHVRSIGSVAPDSTIFARVPTCTEAFTRRLSSGEFAEELFSSLLAPGSTSDTCPSDRRSPLST